MTQFRRMLYAVTFATAAPVTAFAADDCLVTYEEFEEHVTHVDVPHCPRGEIGEDEGFCRLAFNGDKVVVYAFAERGDDHCLVKARAYPVEELWK